MVTRGPFLVQGSKKPFAAFFGAAGIGGRPRLHALLTRSTSGLRALLAGGHALGYDSPLLPSEAERRAMELDQVGRGRCLLGLCLRGAPLADRPPPDGRRACSPNPPRDTRLPPQAAVPMDGSQSLLVFEGGLRVHGLFDFLLNESFRSHGDECDVPLLLAPAQFAHASLQAAAPRALGPSDARDPGRAQHRLELRGAALTPWVLDRLGAVLAVTQVGGQLAAAAVHAVWLNYGSTSCCMVTGAAWLLVHAAVRPPAAAAGWRLCHGLRHPQPHVGPELAPGWRQHRCGSSAGRRRWPRPCLAAAGAWRHCCVWGAGPASH
jgi:hypothetical protein